jgi:hypothetical protein
MPYIVRFRWQDILSQENYMQNLHDPEFKAAVNKGYGAYYHPRYKTAKVIKPTVGTFAIVEFKGKVSNKNNIPEYIDKVLQHLASWGIKDVEVFEPEQVTATEFAMREPEHEDYKYSTRDRKIRIDHTKAKRKPVKKIVKKRKGCGCK